MSRTLALVGVLSVLAASGCASTTYTHESGDNRVRDAFEEPLRDFSVMRENPPPPLIHAAEAPYALPGDGGCGAILEEIAALDTVLGPDLDARDQPAVRSNTDISALLSGAIGGVVGLPYRSIVRRLSGAEARERSVRDAIFAGMVRRAFLKGVAHANNCSASERATLAPADAPAGAASPPGSGTTARGVPASNVTEPISSEPSAAPPSAFELNTQAPSLAQQ
jgi:hypothetical protein